METLTAHARAIAEAERANDDLLKLFDDISPSDIFGDGIYSTYALVVDSLRNRLDDLEYVNRVLLRLRRDVGRIAERLLEQAENIGRVQAALSVEAWGLTRVESLVPSVAIFSLAVDAIKSLMAAQTTQTRALITSGAVDTDALLGTDTQVGLLSPGIAAREIARWVVATSNAANDEGVRQAIVSSGETVGAWGKQLIAAIDARTTETCLLAHGQVRPLDEPFDLSGKPWDTARNYGFSDKQPPHHWWCRDSLALVRLSEADDDLTRILRAAADAELAARAAKDKTPFEGPVNAGSVRPSQRERLRRTVFEG